MGRPRSTSWRVDDTYVKVRGEWTYLHRTPDKFGNMIDFYLSPTRNAKAAKRLLGKALNGLRDWEKPEIISTDKAPTYGIAISELKASRVRLIWDAEERKQSKNVGRSWESAQAAQIRRESELQRVGPLRRQAQQAACQPCLTFPDR